MKPKDKPKPKNTRDFCLPIKQGTDLWDFKLNHPPKMIWFNCQGKAYIA